MDPKIILLQLENAGITIKRKEILKELNLQIYKGETVGIYGFNGSGKSLLSELLAGRMKSDSGARDSVSGLSTAVVSSAEQKKMLEEERYNDDSEFMKGRIDPGRSVGDILRQNACPGFLDSALERYAGMMGIGGILDRGIKFLSTGEFRKMMIAGAMMSSPDILILDDPYTGLDIQTRKNLESAISELLKELDGLVLISGRLGDLKSVDRLMFLDNKTLTEYESTEDIKSVAAEKSRLLKDELKPELNPADSADLSNISAKRSELIYMRNVKMSYYDTRILSEIDWTVFSGEHWQIVGPNGSGKSSLLGLVNGDSPKAYGQDIRLFGVKRGSGETIWEIKQKIGYVSGSLQQQHRIRQNVLSVVISGFFDTIGLYDKPDPVKIEKAGRWCHEFGIEDYLELPFNGLSEGMKRAVLIIRAIVKRPEVLILDEPCQGLDDYNSELVLSVAQRVISRDHSTLIYVSHDPCYRMTEITNILELVPYPEGGYTSVTDDSIE